LNDINGNNKDTLQHNHSDMFQRKSSIHHYSLDPLDHLKPLKCKSLPVYCIKQGWTRNFWFVGYHGDDASDYGTLDQTKMICSYVDEHANDGGATGHV
jgi:hypothetical protein